MKRNISDLLDEQDPENIDILQISPLSAQRIKEMTMEKVRREKPAGKRKPVRILIAAAIIAALATTVVAADDLILSQGWFVRFFSNQEVYAQITHEQLLALEEVTIEVNQSVTCEGYTITLEQAISDGYCTYFKFHITAPEGVALGEHCTFDFDISAFHHSLTHNEQPEMESMVGSLHLSYETVEDPDPTDNRKTIVLRITDNKGHSSKSCVVRITGIDSGESFEYRTFIAEGEWEFQFPLPTQFSQVEMLPEPIIFIGQERGSGKRFTEKITSFALRTLTAVCVTEHKTPWSEPPMIDGIRIVMKNGTVVEAEWQGSTNSEDIAIHDFNFDEPISFADVAYVEFPGGAKALMPEQ